MKSFRLGSLCVGLFAVGLSNGCAIASDEVAIAELGQIQQPVLGVDSHLYLRCNATGWGVTSANRLVPGATAGTFTLEYDMNLAWGPDNCVFTETNQLDGWGSQQSYYAANFASVQVPTSASLVTGGNFNVQYPKQGRYRVTVDWAQRTFSITEATTSAWPQFSVLPVFFVPTDWNVNNAEVQHEANALSVAVQEIQAYYGEKLAAKFEGKSFVLNPLQVVQANGPKENYGIVWNGRSIYEDGVEVDGSMEHLVVSELHSRGYKTPPAQNEDGYSVLIFVKGAGGWAGAREFENNDGGWGIVGDWCIDSIDGTVPEGQYWWSGRRLQLGAAAHELGHTFDLPHPDAYGGNFDESVMGSWWNYPNVGFDQWGMDRLEERKAHWFR